jgi:uncharacterized membrane protein YgcG
VEQYRDGLVIILVVIAVALMVAAFGEETFRAWNLGQAAVVSAVLALVVKR